MLWWNLTTAINELLKASILYYGGRETWVRGKNRSRDHDGLGELKSVLLMTDEAGAVLERFS